MTKGKGKRDEAQAAFDVMQQVIKNSGDASIEPEAKPEKNAAAVELGRKGGLKGGKARAASLTKEQRSDIAKKAAAARWRKKTSN